MGRRAWTSVPAIAFCLLVWIDGALGDTPVTFDYTTWYSTNSGGFPTVNPGNYPITGMQCRNKYCEQLKVYKLKVISDGKARHSTLTTGSSQEIQVSSTQGRGRCNDGLVVIDNFCKGSYCDYNVLKCAKPIGFRPVWRNFYVTAWFNEAQNRQTACKSGYVMIGIYCSGKYCANKKLECAEIRAERVDYSKRMSTNWRKACEYGPGLACSVQLTRSITRTKESSWTKGYSTSVGITAKLESKFMGTGASIATSLSADQTSTIGQMAGEQKNYEMSCGVSTDPSVLEYLILWQYEVTALEYDSPGNKLDMPLCSFWITPNHMRPKCPAGRCGDKYCQKCR